MQTKTKLYIFTLLGIFLATSGFRCTLIKSRQEQQLLQPVKLVYWRTFDSSQDLNEIIAAYRAIHPNITIEVQKLRFDEFERELLNSYADLKPPDIISLHYGWLEKYAQKKFIDPMPDKITMAYQYQKKSLGIKNETITEIRATQTLTAPKVKELFVDTVSKDAIVDEKIYGLPLSVDTLAMFYNRAILNKAQIPLPPSNWQEFQEAVKKTTLFDENKNIVQAGAALGTAKNINRASDIVTLLMRQNGASVIEDGAAQFSRFTSQEFSPGLEALKFYTDFSNPRKEVYGWSNDMPNSLNAFAEGKSAFYFGYSFDIPLLRALSKNKLDFGVAKVPQIQGGQEINMANYWIETVSSRTKYKNEAWDFLLFITKAEQAKKYLDAVKKPTALRSLVSEQLKDDDLNVFASQLLTAQTWYKGLDYNSAERYLEEMIDNVVLGQDPRASINLANQRVQQTITQIIE